MPIIEGYTPVFDIKTAQPPQISVADIPSTGTTAPNAVTPVDAPQTRNRFIQEGINLQQRALQNTGNLSVPSPKPSEAVLNARVEIAPEININQARTRYEETSSGPASIPQEYKQVTIDA